MYYNEKNLWQVEQKGFDERYLGKSEATMALGNGYFGSRSSEEEAYIGEKRDTFVAGTFNSFDENEVTELPNVPDMWGMEFVINDQRFSLTQGLVRNYSKRLNLKNGELSREFIWELNDIKLKFIFQRFISKKRQHLQVSHLELSNLTDRAVSIKIHSGINGQVSNAGSQHFTDGEKGLMNGKFIQMMSMTTHSKIQFVQTVEHKFDIRVSERPETGRRAFFMNYNFELATDSSFTVEKRGSVYTSIDNDLESQDLNVIRKQAVHELENIEKLTYQELLTESQLAWQQIWEKHPIKIDSENFRDQLAIRFAKYHLHVMAPAHNEHMNIGAKGLSGEGYKGHTFWDTEVFMLPYFNFTHPEIAKNLVTYRYLGLDGAHKKAKVNGYEGAQYPWEAANPDDGEVAPVWGAADIVSGQSIKIWSGFIEQHITSDVAFGIKQYIDVTGDKVFEVEKAYEILIDTAKFWASRLEYIQEDDSYEIRDVIGPDEYKEHVNNNAYTNYTAHWNVNFVIDLIQKLKSQKTDIYDKLDQKFNLNLLTENLSEKVDKIFLPKATADGIIPQDDTYLGKKILDLQKYRDSDGVDSLFHDYNLEQVNQMQITKQADVLLLMLLFEGLFDKEQKLKNFDYYEPKTTHDSSLSLSTHAILSADLGKLEQSYDFFNKAINIDMGEYMKSSDAGIHAASLGGIWQMIVFGYGGVRMIESQLRIEPHLPKKWKVLEYGFDYHGEAIHVELTKDKMNLSKENNDHVISFMNKGQKYLLKNQLTIKM